MPWKRATELSLPFSSGQLFFSILCKTTRATCSIERTRWTSNSFLFSCDEQVKSAGGGARSGASSVFSSATDASDVSINRQIDRFIRGQFVGEEQINHNCWAPGIVSIVLITLCSTLDLPSFLAATVFRKKNKKGSGQWRVNVEQTEVVVDMIQKRTTPENWPSQF